MVRIRDQQNFAAGLFFVMVGAVTLFAVQDLRLGTAMRMGPGYAPLLLGGCLAVLGAIMAVQALAVSGPDLERWSWGPLLRICGGVAFFALAIPYAGLVLASIGSVLIACLGGHESGWLHRIAFAVILSGGAALLFVGLLKLPMPLWPL